MSDLTTHGRNPTPGELIRAFRNRHKLFMEDLADRLRDAGVERPSIAKLSRIENDLQQVPTTLLGTLTRVTGIPASQLRPDLAKLFRPGPSRTRRRSRAA